MVDPIILKINKKIHKDLLKRLVGKSKRRREIPQKLISVLLNVILVFELIAGTFLFPVPIQETYANPGPGDWYNASWGYRKKITIDYTKVGTALTNFAVLVSVTDADLKDTANGGHVGQSDGGDIVFTNSSGIKLDHEIEKYTNTTGELVAWVEVDSLSSTADTILYIYYGGPSTPDQWNINGTWDEGGTASYKMVQHLKETSGVHSDSTVNANNGTPYPALAQGDVSITSCDNTTDWTGTSLSTDASDKKEGTASLVDTVSAPVPSTTYTTSYNPAGSWNLGTRYLDFWFTSDRANTAFTSARVYIYDTSGNWRYHNLTFSAATWKKFNLGITSGGTTSVTPPSASAIDKIEWQFVAADATAFYKKIDIVYANGGVVQGTTGQINGADVFDGVNDYVVVPNNASLNLTNGGTVELWLKNQGTSSGDLQGLFIRNLAGANVGDNLLGYVYSTNKIRFTDGRTDGFTLFSNDTIFSNSWGHVAIQMSSTDGTKMYVNGNVQSQTNATILSGWFSNSAVILISLPVDNAGFYQFNGLIDEVRIYNRALSAEEISTHYNNQNSPSTFYSVGSEVALPTIQFTSATSSGAESSTPAQLELSIATPFEANVTVDYAVTGGTASGGGVDYTLADGTAAITAGNTTATIDAVIVDDAIDELDETIEVTISNPVNASLGTNTVHTYTIQDNDTAGITVNPTSGLTTTEAGGTATFTVVLNSEPTADVSIGLSSSDTTEGTVSPSSLTFTSANWNTAQTVTVTGVNDSVDDGDIAYTIATAPASSTDPNYNNLNPDDVSVSNTDNDEPTPLGGGGGLPTEAYNAPTAPESGFKILVNNDAAETDSRKVVLTLMGGSNTKAVWISESSQFPEGFQSSYNSSLSQISVSFNLSEGEGTKNVYAKFCTQWGRCSEVVSDSIIYKKEIPEEKPIAKLPPPEVTPPTEKPSKPPLIERVPEILKPLIPEILKPKPPEIKPPEIPIVELVPKEAPLAFQAKWQLLPSKPIREFVLAPLPREIRKLAEKFPELGKTLKEVGITKITDIEKLKTVKLTLPGLTERVGLPTAKVEPGKFALPSGVPVAELSPAIKQQIPSEIVFAKTAGELIDFNIALSVTEKGEPQQKISTISGKPLQLVIKPDKPVKSVRGYVVFKSKSPRPTSFQLPFNSLLASVIFANPVFAKPQEKPVRVEEKLVLLEFEYTDPDGDGIYTAEIQAPVIEGEYEIITVMDFEDPELGKKEIRLTTVIDPEGYLYEKDGDKETRIPGAIVSLFWLNPETKQYEIWPAKEYQQENPQTTDVRGTYSFLVPEGYYYLKAEAPGYLVYDGKPFQVKEGSGIHVNIELKTKYWWLKIVDWKTILLAAVIILLLYNFYRDKIREKLLKSPKGN